MDEQPTPADLPQLSDEQAPINPAAAQRDELAAVYGVPVKLTVEVGQRTISIAEAAEVSTGAIVPLDRQADQPLDVLVNGKLIAKGEIVVVDNELGVRIVEVVDVDPEA